MKYNIELLNRISELPEDSLSVQYLKKGGIHIKKKNKGKFTEYCGGKVTQECITRGKNSSNPKIRKRATFASNARKWKHAQGGIIEKPSFEEWYRTIPESKNDTIRYNLRRAFELAPWEDLKNFANNENGEGEFLKRFDHPTIKDELDAYNNTTEFKRNFRLNATGDFYKYEKRLPAIPIMQNHFIKNKPR